MYNYDVMARKSYALASKPRQRRMSGTKPMELHIIAAIYAPAEECRDTTISQTAPPLLTIVKAHARSTSLLMRQSHDEKQGKWHEVPITTSARW